MIRLLVLLIALGCTIALVQSAAAQEPPTDTPPPLEPTRTPRPDEGTLIVHVINDLNRNGRRDASEPGLEGWTANPGCGNALDFFRLGVSDSSGTIVDYWSYPDGCVWIEVQFGWFLTSRNFVRVHVPAGDTVEVVFLVRKVGERVQRFSGGTILSGLPAPTDSTVDALVNGRSCGDGQVGESHALTGYQLYVLSGEDRAGCAREGGGLSR